MGRIADIGKIVKQADCDNLKECEDGSYSTSKGRGACAGHGGVKGSKKRAVRAKKAAPNPKKVKGADNDLYFTPETSDYKDPFNLLPEESKKIVLANITPRLRVLRNSLKKKEEELARRFGNYFGHWKQTHGSPVNDKRGAAQFFRKEEKINDSIRNQKEEIKKTIWAIETEEEKILDAFAALKRYPACVAKMVANGILNPWRKHPHILFVEGVKGARIYTNKENESGPIKVGYLRKIPNYQQREKFKSVWAELKACEAAEIGAIYKNPPTGLELFECRDGTYSTSPNCSWHKGPKTGIPVEFTIIRKKGKSQQQKFAEKAANMLDAGVTLIPIGAIKENRAWFQNRASAFSDRSVNNIVNAAKTGKFLWVNFDPITVWPGPAGKLYVLSGHSRLESFKRLCKLGVLADGRDFCHIPAKVAKGLSKEEARKVALESNTLSTKETDLERAQFYANMRAKGVTKGEIQEKAKQLEGQNASKIVAFSYLNPIGKTMNALVLLDKGDQTSKSNMENIGRWIGNARKRFGQLTNSHEDELFVWLVNNKGYGTSKGQISNERDFKSRLESIINRRTEFGQLMERLNVASSVSKSPAEREYDAQMAELRSQLAKLKNQIKAKTVDLARKGAKDARIINIIQPLQARQTRLEAELKRLTLKKSDVLNAARNEITLF